MCNPRRRNISIVVQLLSLGFVRSPKLLFGVKFAHKINHKIIDFR